MIDPNLHALKAADEWQPFKDAVARAVNSGPDGEAVLIELISDPEVDDWKRAEAIGAIGECEGPMGADVLRAIAEDDDHDWEMRYPALVGLVQRQGAEASDVFARCLHDDDLTVGDCAARALAFVGNGSYLELMTGRLISLLSEPPPINPRSKIQLPGQSPKLITIVYLARYASTRDKRRQIIELVRSRWDKFLVQEQEWLTFAWPAMDPQQGDPDTIEEPDWKSMVTWVGHSAFDTIYISPRGMSQP